MKFDVVIIGGSTAGLHAARILAEQGRRVAVFERRPDHQTERRTLIVTHALKEVLGGIVEEIALRHIETMGVASRREETAIRLREPDPVVERAAMTKLLTGQAIAAGAAMFYGWRFKNFTNSSSLDEAVPLEILFECSNGRSLGKNGGTSTRIGAAEAVIGSDGALSDVAVASGIARPPCVPLIQAECILPKAWDPGSCKVWFKVDETRYFYWLIPESDRHCVVGLIGERGVRVRQLLERFLDRQGLEPQAWQAGHVAMHHPRLKPWTKIKKVPVYLVGDAAGQVKVTTVDGTVTGLQGAEAAARAILQGTSYRSELRPVKRELDLHWWVRWALERLDNRGYDHLVRAVSGDVKNFLGKYNRDTMVPVFWKLPFIEPRLIRIGMQCLAGKSPRHRRTKTQTAGVREDV